MADGDDAEEVALMEPWRRALTVESHAGEPVGGLPLRLATEGAQAHNTQGCVASRRDGRDGSGLGGKRFDPMAAVAARAWSLTCEAGPLLPRINKAFVSQETQLECGVCRCEKSNMQLYVTQKVN